MMSVLIPYYTLRTINNSEVYYLSMTKDYVSISLPRRMVELVDGYIDSGKTIYTNRSEFIKDAIRIRLRDLGVVD